ncbi:hypothetical protein I4U23_026576 [Adineta vaga]|nr:hypothetical protein I4U23_026576 [Adineta vaga]
MKPIYIVLALVSFCMICTEGFLLSKGNGTSTKTKAPKKEKCMIVKGKGKNFIGDIIHIHKEFAPTLKKIDNIAKQCHIKLAIKGSYEQVPDLSKSLKLTTANVGKRLKFVIMDETGKKLLCNNICLAKEGEKVPQVKCLATNLRRENLRFEPHNEVGTLDDASDAKPGFADFARRTQEACKGVKL